MNYLEKIPVPPRNTFNLGLRSPENAYMLEMLGHPVKGGLYRKDGSCTAPNNPRFTALLLTRSVGPFRVTGLAPAVQSLEAVLGRVRAELPDLYALLGTAGMQCSRFTKIKQPDGSIKVGPGVSNHSWGTAIDLRLGGQLDGQGDNQTQRGLLILSAYFNAAGWYWGAAFPVEDAMHFEVSRALLGRWKQSGQI